MPERVQLKRTKGWKMPPNTVKVDRATGFGNPFPVIKGTQTHMGETTDVWTVGTWSGPAMWFQDTREAAIALAVEAFSKWVMLPAQERLRQRAQRELRGKNLGCWCKPGEPCHADVWLKLANPQ